MAESLRTILRSMESSCSIRAGRNPASKPAIPWSATGSAENTARDLRRADDQRGGGNLRHITPVPFTSRTIIVYTSPLDDFEYSKDDIAALFRRRWEAELNLRSLKTVMKMDHLRCKEPHRVRNELRAGPLDRL